MTPPARRHRSTGRITLADVARTAGVSPSTASRALRGERAVDPDLVARVLAVTDTLGYVPDPAARALASQRSDHVAILIPLLSNALFVDLLESAQSTLRQAGYQTLIGVTHYDSREEEQLLREQLLHRPAGLLVTGLDHSPATRQLIARSGVPCVHLMELPTRPASPEPGARAGELASHCVGFRQVDAGAALTRRVGVQHALDTDYFNRMDALNYAIGHDDGQGGRELDQADVVLVGVSRTSKNW